MTNGLGTNGLLRLIGITAIGIGAAWALQVLGLGGSSAMGRLAWIVSAATVAGAGTGLIYAATSLTRDGSARA